MEAAASSARFHRKELVANRATAFEPSMAAVRTRTFEQSIVPRKRSASHCFNRLRSVQPIEQAQQTVEDGERMRRATGNEEIDGDN